MLYFFVFALYLSAPLKCGKTCNYFDGEISDENASIRFCGFDVRVRRRLVEYFEREEAVSVHNCEVKKSRYMDKLEVLFK